MLSLERLYPWLLSFEQIAFPVQCLLAFMLPCLLYMSASFLFLIKPKLSQWYFLEVQEPKLIRAFESKQQQGGDRLVAAYRRQLGRLEDILGIGQKVETLPNAMSGLMAGILSKGTSTGVVMEAFTPEAAFTEQGRYTLPIAIVVSGSFYQISLFLKKLHAMSPMLQWHAFDLVKKERAGRAREGGEHEALQMTMLLHLYRYVS